MTGPGAKLIDRFSAARVRTALGDTPVVMVTGPRQCGKTTLVRQFIEGKRRYITLDDDTEFEASRRDPVGFLRGLDRVVIDEVQRVPALLRAIKRSVDEDRRPGRFLLTGSANVLTLPQVSESLAGRMEVVSLLPISRAEICGVAPAFLHRAFSGKVADPAETLIGADLLDAVLTGGFPEMLRREDPRRRQVWASEYVEAIVQRDVQDVAQIEKLDQLRHLIRVLAHHSGRLTNFAQIGAQIQLDAKTTRRYVDVLEQLFMVRRVEPWFRSRLKRLVKTPKLHFLDSGLLAAMLGATAERIAKDRSIFGPLLESFVFSEILKQAAWSDGTFAMHHYRDKDQDEVDVVVENDQGRLIGIEVKAAATVVAADFKGLRKLAVASRDGFKLGVVLYDGERIVPFGERLFAAPISCVWG